MAGVVAGDVDGDGDTDVGTAEYSIKTVSWYENDNGSPPGWAKHVVDEFASGPVTVKVAAAFRAIGSMLLRLPALASLAPGALAPAIRWGETGAPPRRLCRGGAPSR